MTLDGCVITEVKGHFSGGGPRANASLTALVFAHPLGPSTAAAVQVAAFILGDGPRANASLTAHIFPHPLYPSTAAAGAAVFFFGRRTS